MKTLFGVIFLLFMSSCQGQKNKENVTKTDEIKLDNKENQMETGILSEYAKKNGYKELSYDDFKAKCNHFFGIRLNEEAADYSVSLGAGFEYSINEYGRFLYTSLESLFYQPEIEGKVSGEQAKKMLDNEENGLGAKFAAYNKLIFNDAPSVSTYFLRHPDELAEVVFDLDYENNPMLVQKALNVAKEQDLYREKMEKILFYNNADRRYRKELIGLIYKTYSSSSEDMLPFENLVYRYHEEFTALPYAQEVKDECLVCLIKHFIDFDTRNVGNIVGIEDEKAYQHLSNFLSTDAGLASRLSEKDFYGSAKIKELVQDYADLR